MAGKKSRDPATGRFLPGNSGGGRKPLPEDVRKKLQESGMESVDTLLAVMRDKKARAADRIRAAEIVLSYGYGKPRQAIEIESGNDKPCGVVLLPMRGDEDDKTVEEAAARYAAYLAEKEA